MYKLLFTVAIATLIMIPFGKSDSAGAAMKNLRECNRNLKENTFTKGSCKDSNRLHSETQRTYGLTPEKTNDPVDGGDTPDEGSGADDGDDDHTPDLGGEDPAYHGNNGHGNDADGNDNSNPGNSNDANDNTDDDGTPGNSGGNGNGNGHKK